jgi:hypothetical protein
MSAKTIWAATYRCCLCFAVLAGGAVGISRIMAAWVSLGCRWAINAADGAEPNADQWVQALSTTVSSSNASLKTGIADVISAVIRTDPYLITTLQSAAVSSSFNPT